MSIFSNSKCAHGWGERKLISSMPKESLHKKKGTGKYGGGLDRREEEGEEEDSAGLVKRGAIRFLHAWGKKDVRRIVKGLAQKSESLKKKKTGGGKIENRKEGQH